MYDFTENQFKAYYHWHCGRLYFMGKLKSWRFANEKPCKVTPDTFQKYEHKDTVIRLSTRIPNLEDLKFWYVSCFVIKPDAFILEMIHPSDEMESYHIARTKYWGASNYYCSSDIRRLSLYLQENNLTLSDVMKPTGKFPRLFSPDIGLSFETIAILDKTFNFSQVKGINPLWNIKRVTLGKYAGVIDTPDKCNSIIEALNDINK